MTNHPKTANQKNVVPLQQKLKNNSIMKQITINIQNWNRVDDKTILKVVKNAVDNLAKYGRENNGTNREYFTDDKNRVELQFIFK